MNSLLKCLHNAQLKRLNHPIFTLRSVNRCKVFAAHNSIQWNLYMVTQPLTMSIPFGTQLTIKTHSNFISFQTLIISKIEYGMKFIFYRTIEYTIGRFVWNFLHVANCNWDFSYFKFHSRVEKELFKSKNAKYSLVISRRDIDDNVNMHQANWLQGNVIQTNHLNGIFTTSIQKTTNHIKIDKTKTRKVNVLRVNQLTGSRKLLSRYSINKNLFAKWK